MSALRRFLARHAWSSSLSLLSGVSFLRLAREVAEGELDPFDRAVAGWFEPGRGRWDDVMLTLTRLGAFSSMATICGGTAALLALRGKRWEAAYVVACGAGAALLCTGLKLIFQRLRPGASSLYLLTVPQSFSFPSGHTMGTAGVVGSFVIVVYALHARRPWRVLAVGLAVPFILGVAASRIYFGVHFPSDVVGGQLGAAAWVAAVTGWFYPRLLPAEASVRP
jgi:undecaprenyl-diphosphatase